LIEICNDYLIGPNGNTLMPEAAFAQAFGSSGEALTTLRSSITLAVYCIVLLGASLYMFSKRDITA